MEIEIIENTPPLKLKDGHEKLNNSSNKALVDLIKMQDNIIAELEKENQLLKAEVKLWKAASENNSYKAFQLQEENKTLSKYILELGKRMEG